MRFDHTTLRLVMQDPRSRTRLLYPLIPLMKSLRFLLLFVIGVSLGGCATRPRSPGAGRAGQRRTEAELRASYGPFGLYYKDFCVAFKRAADRRIGLRRVTRWARLQMRFAHLSEPSSELQVVDVFSPRWLVCPLTGERSPYGATVMRRASGETYVDVLWGGGRCLYGLRIGAEDFVPPKDSGYYLKWGDGVYIWIDDSEAGK